MPALSVPPYGTVIVTSNPAAWVAAWGLGVAGLDVIGDAALPPFGVIGDLQVRDAADRPVFGVGWDLTGRGTGGYALHQTDITRRTDDFGAFGVRKVVPDGTEEEEWKWVVEATKECFAHAQKVGVRVAIEPLNRFETYFFNRGAQALALADAVHPDCGVCLDAYHLNMEEFDIHDAIRQVGKRLFDFHVADNNRFAAGLGHLDWPRIIATLREVGYDGALTNEFVAPVDRTPAAPYPEMVERNPVDISPEQLKFIQDHGSSLLTEKFYDEQMRITAETLLPLIR